MINTFYLSTSRISESLVGNLHKNLINPIIYYIYQYLPCKIYIYIYKSINSTDCMVVSCWPVQLCWQISYNLMQMFFGVFLHYTCSGEGGVERVVFLSGIGLVSGCDESSSNNVKELPRRQQQQQQSPALLPLYISVQAIIQVMGVLASGM